MRELITEALDRLSRFPGVRGAMVVDAHAGVPVSVIAGEDLDAVAVSALTTHFMGRLTRAASAAEFGEVRGAEVAGEAGRLVIAASGDLVVVVVADLETELGALRLETRRVAEGLR